MRLTQFDLTRYGKFTDTSVVFPEPASGKPDFHLIYGANEAGKSTFLSAWLDFLFEFPAQSPMDFLHAYSALRLDAQLTLNGKITRLSRLKKRTGSLLDQDDVSVPSAVLDTALHGLNRDSYAAMFSLDRQRLDDGGESILASKGDLGALLFQASAGLTGLSAQLGEAHRESDAFLSRSGRKGRLRDLRKELDALNEQIKTLDTGATEYARLTKDRDTARATYDAARGETLTLQRTLSGTERQIAAIPFVARLQQLDTQLADFRDLPDAKPDWIADLAALDRTETTLTAELQYIGEMISALDKALSQLTPDEAVLALSDQIAQAEALKSGHDSSTQDLPRRHGELDALAAKINDCLARLGQPEAQARDCVPDLATMSGLRTLAERRTTLAANLNAAQKEEQTAQTAVAEAARALGGMQEKPHETGSLERLVAQIRHADLVGTKSRLRAELASVAAELKRACADLGIAEPDTVSAIALPDPALLDRIEQTQTAAQREVERLSAQFEDIGQAQETQSEQLAAIRASGTVTAEDVAQVRAQREAAWATHKATLSAQTAKDFENALRLDDQMTATLAAQHSRSERVAELTASIDTKARARKDIAARLDAARSDLTKAAERLAALFDSFPVTFDPDTPMSVLRNWLGRLSTAKDLAGRHAVFVARLAECETQTDQARRDLISALAALDAPPQDTTSLRIVLETAQTVLDRSGSLRRLQDTHQSALTALTKRREVVASARSALEGWSQDWTRIAGRTWLAGLCPETTPLRPVLDEIEHLRSVLEKHTDLSRRIAGMQDNVDRFTAAVAELAEVLICAPSWDTITQRLTTARETARQLTEKNGRRREATLKRDELEASARQHRARLDNIASHFGTSDWSQTYDALTRAGQRSDLARERAQVSHDLCKQMQAVDEASALEAMRTQDEAGLNAARAAVEADLSLAQTAQNQAHSAFLDADRAVQDIGGDDAIARLQEQRQTLLMVIEDEARAHLRQRLGLLSLERALHVYRNTHRSEMLNRASDAFRAMTLGRYNRLVAQPDGMREVLAAISDSGASLLADHLSEGTREQLYLALRIAGYHEFLQQKGPVPFIADDIMESFDDDRAGAAFALLGDMARSGQVIYLTHHAHMCDLARAHCPDVQVHNLTG